MAKSEEGCGEPKEGAAVGQTSPGGISGRGGMRWGMVCSPACSADVSSGCMPLPVECRYCSRGPGMNVGAFFPGEAASSDPWLKASLCRNGLGWGLGCKHQYTA